MTDMAMHETVEQLSASLVLVEADDYPALTRVHTSLEEISNWAQSGGHDMLQSATSSAAKLIEQIILEECDNPAVALDVVGKTVTALQEIIRDGRDISKSLFPNELEISGDAAATAQPDNDNTADAVSAEIQAAADFAANDTTADTDNDVEPQAQQQTSDSDTEEEQVTHPGSLPSNIDEGMYADFLGRQPSVLQEMEELVLFLEKQDDEEKREALMRLLHTMKGESALMGLDDIQRLCHATEDLVNTTHPGHLVDVLLNVKDWLGQAFDSYINRVASDLDVQSMIDTVNQASAGTQEDSEQQDQQICDQADSTQQQQDDDIATVDAGDTIDSTVVDSDTAATDTADDATTSDVADAGEPMKLEGDLGLVGDFVTESKEHLDEADIQLLSIETDPENKDTLNALFRVFHTIKGVAGFVGLTEITSLAHEAENLLDKARKGEILLAGAAIDATFDSVDMLKRMINMVAEALASDGTLPCTAGLTDLTERIKAVADGKEVPQTDATPAGQPGRKVGQILTDAGKATEDDVAQALEKQQEVGQKIGEILVAEGKVPAKDVAQALRQQKQPAAADTAAASTASLTKQAGIQVKEAVKVDADRLDRLVDAIGELVIAESMVSQAEEIRKLDSTHVSRQMSLLDKITRELQEMGMGLRMVPVRQTFQKMARLVRDLAKKANKSVEFVMNGEDTELDKTVVDKIGDPLVHMVRNAVDHGIEPDKQQRIDAGKSPTAKVELRAFHKEGNIHIEIADDGRGLNKESIIAKAKEKGLIREGDNLSDRDIYNLIFEPGFSTAKQITDVSGRGVGMDVVKRNIEALRGQVEIRSELGVGTTFTIRLPLTLAIIDGMVIRVGSERYIIPTLSIVRSIRPQAQDIASVFNKGEMLTQEEHLIPLFRLANMYNVPNAESDPTKALVVIIEDDGKQVGLLADELLGQQQIVIKNLGETMKGIPGLSGGAIMPDGRVGLILDASGLVKLATTYQQHTMENISQLDSQ